MKYVHNSKIDVSKMEYMALFFNQSSIDTMIDWIQTNDGVYMTDKPIAAPHITFKFGKCPIIPVELMDMLHEVLVIGYARAGDEQGYLNLLPAPLQSIYEGQENIHTTMGLGKNGRAFLTGKLPFESIENPFSVRGFLGYWDRENKEVLIPTTNEKLDGKSVE